MPAPNSPPQAGGAPTRAELPPDIDLIDERDGGTLFGFIDPDGNSWVAQQIEARA